MNISIKKATSDLFDQLVDFLIKNHLYKTKKKYWYALLEHDWSKLSHRGYCLFDEKKIVGFFGIIFSDLYINQSLKFANVTTWVVNRDYRGHSIKLLKKIMENDSFILISHSTIKEILKIYFRYNWKIFEDKYYLVFNYTINPFKSKYLKIINNDSFNDPYLNKIRSDHIMFNCNCKKIIVNNNELLIIGKIKKYKRFIKYFEIFFISDLKIFNKNIFSIFNSLKYNLNFNFMKIDKRFIIKKHSLFFLERNYHNIKKIYYSKDTNLTDYSQINNLYSENFLLDI